jgi:putative CocE/NonD family hydrolase
VFTRKWSTSERKYDVAVERDVKVRMPDGATLDGDIYRPASSERFPAILGAHPYNKDLQSPPIMLVGFTPMRGYMESGDSTFFARRGYVHAVFNVRGTGKSEGFYQLLGPREVEDICYLIDWLTAQSWSSGDVAMFGVSYFAKLAKLVAANNPKSLKAIFAPFAGADEYRHRSYHGGILAHGFLAHGATVCTCRDTEASIRRWSAKKPLRTRLPEPCATRSSWRCRSCAKRSSIRRPGPIRSSLMSRLIRSTAHSGRRAGPATTRPRCPLISAHAGATYGLHLPGAFTAWKEWKGPKKMVIGPGR